MPDVPQPRHEPVDPNRVYTLAELDRVDPAAADRARERFGLAPRHRAPAPEPPPRRPPAGIPPAHFSGDPRAAGRESP